MHIIGHMDIRKKLRRSLDEKRLSQAYLFTGPRGVGKSLCATEFASLLALEPDFEPSSGKPHPYDVLILRPEEETKRGVTKTKKISVEDVRAAISFLGKFPAQGGFRTVIIEDAHRLSDTAENALLKTLEEPNPSSVLILVTHEPGNILPTVHSRVKHVRFDFVAEDEIKQGLEKIYQPAALREIAPFFFSLGRPGMVIRALSEPENFLEAKEKLGLLFRLSTLSLSERMSLAEKLSSHTEQSILLLEWWLPGLHAQAMKTEERKMMTKFFGLLAEVEKTIVLMKTTQSNSRLLLEKLFLNI